MKPTTRIGCSVCLAGLLVLAPARSVVLAYDYTKVEIPEGGPDINSISGRVTGGCTGVLGVTINLCEKHTGFWNVSRTHDGWSQSSTGWAPAAWTQVATWICDDHGPLTYLRVSLANTLDMVAGSTYLPYSSMDLELRLRHVGPGVDGTCVIVDDGDLLGKSHSYTAYWNGEEVILTDFADNLEGLGWSSEATDDAFGYAPVEPFGQFYGSDVHGAWVIEVRDRDGSRYEREENDYRGAKLHLEYDPLRSTTTTAQDGRYSLNQGIRDNGIYRIVPALGEAEFSPAELARVVYPPNTRESTFVGAKYYSGQVVNCDFAAMGSISGRVTEGDADGKPLESVVITAYRSDGSIAKQAVTDADGYYYFSGLPHETYSLTAHKAYSGIEPHKQEVTVGSSPVVASFYRTAICAGAPAIIVELPNDGEVWEVGKTAKICWGSDMIDGNVTVGLSRDGGASYETLLDDTPNDGQESWTVTAPATANARIRVRAMDGSAEGFADFVINVPPMVTALAVPAVIPVNVDIIAVAIFSDPADDVHAAAWNWGDGWSGDGVLDETTASVSGSHTYDTPGVYMVTVTVADGYGDSHSLSESIVVYDPNAGFVTGGGWADSPAGAYAANPSLAGKAAFAFVCKYNKGATVPVGNMEFQVKSGRLNFRSTSYDWLLVSGSDDACFKGSGTINGRGAYEFMIWARDNALDSFRIKIWAEDEEASEIVIYDNGFDQVLGGGSIVIHDRQVGRRAGFPTLRCVPRPGPCFEPGRGLRRPE